MSGSTDSLVIFAMVTRYQRTSSTTTVNIVGDIIPPLGHPKITLEGCSKVSTGPCNNNESVPVALEETYGTRDCSISRQDFEATVAVQGVIFII